MLPFLVYQILLCSFTSQLRLRLCNFPQPGAGEWGNSLKPVTSLEKLEMGLGSDLDLELASGSVTKRKYTKSSSTLLPRSGKPLVLKPLGQTPTQPSLKHILGLKLKSCIVCTILYHSYHRICIISFMDWVSLNQGYQLCKSLPLRLFKNLFDNVLLELFGFDF